VREQIGFDLGRLDWARLDTARPSAELTQEALKCLG
jgi:hypothetical protein